MINCSGRHKETQQITKVPCDDSGRSADDWCDTRMSAWRFHGERLYLSKWQPAGCQTSGHFGCCMMGREPSECRGTSPQISSLTLVCEKKWETDRQTITSYKLQWQNARQWQQPTTTSSTAMGGIVFLSLSLSSTLPSSPSGTGLLQQRHLHRQQGLDVLEPPLTTSAS